MKTISTLIFALLCASFCIGTPPLIAKTSWALTTSFSAPEDDKKMSMIHQKLSDISAYENVKEKVCPGNQAKWGFWKHSETGKIIVENNAKILPWYEAVEQANALAVGDKMRPSARLVSQFTWNWPHVEMNPFVRCLNHCFDLSEIPLSAVHQENFFLIKSLIDADFAVNKDVIEPLPLPWRLVIAWETPPSFFIFIAQNKKTFILLGSFIFEQVFKFVVPCFATIMFFVITGDWYGVGNAMSLLTPERMSEITVIPLTMLTICDDLDPSKFSILQRIYRGIIYLLLLAYLNVPMSLFFVVFIKWFQFFRYNQPMAKNQLLFLVSLSILFFSNFFFKWFDWDKPAWIKKDLKFSNGSIILV